MALFSSDHFQKIWSTWEVRVIVLFSLFLQSFLILVSPFRTKTANVIVSVPLWLAYLLADSAAVFAVGLISNSQEDTSIDKSIMHLLAFWAPILIIHLGGPDPITALALEDNELWQRHFLQLISQFGSTVYVLYRSVQHSELLPPTLLVLAAGLIKYGERVYSLYRASVNKFRESLLTTPDPGRNYQRYRKIKFPETTEAGPSAGIEHNEKRETKLEVSSDATVEDISDLRMVQDAHKWFAKFKGLVAGLIYSNDDWKETRAYFRKRNPEQAFRVVEIELNFIYEVLYTKMPVIRTWVGYIFRLICSVLVLVSFFLWHSIHKSHHIPGHDVKITYVLLGGAITLDVIAFFMLILSDWSIVYVMKSTNVSQDKRTSSKLKSRMHNKLKRLMRRYLEISKPRWSEYSEKDKTALSKFLSSIFRFRSPSAEAKERKTIPFLVMASRILFRRWSESIQQFNLIEYSINMRNEKLDKVYGWLGLAYFLDGIQHVSTRWFSVSLRKSIFSELKAKSDTMEKPEDADTICNVRGEWVLKKELSKIGKIKWEELKKWLTEIDYDESLILWHIATEVCYNHDIDKEEDARQQNDQETSDEKEAKPQKDHKSMHEENHIEQQESPKSLEENKADQQKHPDILEKEDNDQQRNKCPERVEEEDNVQRDKSHEIMEEEHVQRKKSHEITEEDDAEQQRGHEILHEDKVILQKNDREISKTLSDYMLYLLIREPKIMTAVAGIGQFRFRDTCAEAKKFFKGLVIDKKEKRVRDACSKLLEVSTDIPPKEAKGDRSKSLLFEGCRLAKKLKELEDDKWTVIHKVWVEMLSYAATHCSGNAHAAQLSKGGQLITFVWLLMVHLGLGKQFRINEGSKSTTQ